MLIVLAGIVATSSRFVLVLNQFTETSGKTNSPAYEATKASVHTPCDTIAF
jgi:lipopolysaccharide export system protein LptC